MLSISLAGWLCPVIVMLARLWHLCYMDGKCLSNHLLAAQFEFSSSLMDSSWRIIVKKMKSSLTLNATAVATPLRCPTVLLTKAVDGCTASPCGPLPFSCCVSAQRLNLVAFHIVVERPSDRPRPFSDLNNTQTLYPPLCPGSGAYIHVREQQHFRAQCVFFMAEPASLKPKHSYWPTSHLCLSLSSPRCFLVWNNIACLLLLIPEDWAPVSAPLSLVLY